MLADLLNSTILGDDWGVAAGWSAPGVAPEFIFRGQCSRGGPAISPHTLWEAASLSKPVVALLAADCANKDPALLDRPLLMGPGDFGAAADPRWGQLTLRHALTHTTGLPNWRPLGEKLVFESEPGSSGYSGEGYELLLAELAKTAGQPAEDLLEGLLQRLGMGASTFTPGIARAATSAIGHAQDGQPQPGQEFTKASAAGSLHTTVGDYLRFLQLVADPETALGPGLREAAAKIAQPADAAPGRTMGWASSHTGAGDVLWQHGDNPGFKHVAAVRHATREALVVFTNTDLGQELYRSFCKHLLQVDVW